MVETSTFSPECRGIGDNITFNFEEEGAALTDSVAEAETGIQLDTVAIHTTTIVVAGSDTTTGKNIEVATALGVPVMEGVIQRKEEFSGDGTMSVHRDGGIGNTPTHFSSLILMRAFVALTEPSGVVVAETQIGTTVNLFLKHDTGTGIESTAPEGLVYAIEKVYVGLIVEGDSRTYAPIAPESVLRILRNLVLGKGTACKNQHAEQYREF